MEDVKREEDVPPRVMEMLRIFLAASSRGEHAVLVLETRKRTLTTKYRSVEVLAGTPAPTCSSSVPNNVKRKRNPAWARRSKARLEEFNRRKVEEKIKQGQTSQEHLQTGEKDAVSQAAGDSSSNTNRLVLQLGNVVEDRPVEAGLQSPILQVDGEGENSDEVYFTFKSEYGEEDVIYSLGEMFPPDVVTSTTLVSRVRLGKLWETADHQYCVRKVSQWQEELFLASYV